MQELLETLRCLRRAVLTPLELHPLELHHLIEDKPLTAIIFEVGKGIEGNTCSRKSRP